MIEESLASHDSIIHRIDPGVRIACAFLLSFAAALSQNFFIIGTYFALALVLIFMASLGAGQVLKRLKTLLWFILMIWIILPFSYEGEIFARIGPMAVTVPGIELCQKITLKSITILLVFMALMATMTVATMGHSLHRLHVPDKFVFLLLMTYRYIFVIEGEYKRLLRAARFRGFRPGTNLHSYRTYAYLAGMLFVRASCRAQRVHQAMLCRGFNGKFNTLDSFSSTLTNYFFMTGISLVTVLLVLIENFWI